LKESYGDLEIRYKEKKIKREIVEEHLESDVDIEEYGTQMMAIRKGKGG
jgi:hypothetical protein